MVVVVAVVVVVIVCRLVECVSPLLWQLSLLVVAIFLLFLVGVGQLVVWLWTRCSMFAVRPLLVVPGPMGSLFVVVVVFVLVGLRRMLLFVVVVVGWLVMVVMVVR